MAIHVDPTAVVDPNAVLDEDVSIGPYSVIGAGAFIGSGTRVLNHVTITGNVRIGHDNVIYPHCVIGAEPQDLSYRGSPTWVVIGDRNLIREMVTIHRGTEKEYGITRIGSDNFFMCGCHVGHDCVVGSHVHMANATTLGGHVHVHDYAALSGLIGVHHFTTIGSYSFIGGMSRIVTDVPPYMLVEGNPAVARCVNTVGLKRRGFDAQEIRSLTEAHRLRFRAKMTAEQALKVLESRDLVTESVKKLFDFIAEQRLGKNGRARERFRKAA
jgi:UDP-N-acetylglucosamine acyltransferase